MFGLYGFQIFKNSMIFGGLGKVEQHLE